MSMDLDRLYKILGDATGEFRKGDVFEGTPELVKQAVDGIDPEKGLQGGGVLHIYSMPHESEANGVELVDCHFIKVGVNKEAAERNRAAFIEVLSTYPNPDRLASGPSYIEVGGEVGSQDGALQMFALGKVLGLWDVITPAMFGIEGEQADQMAGAGYVMMSGYRSPEPTP